MNSIIERGIDLLVEGVFKVLVYAFKNVSPIKIYPKQIKGSPLSDWSEIRNLKIKNRLNREMFDIYIEGLSNTQFDIKMISDDSPDRKTLEYMSINTNQMAFIATDERTNNRVWIFRIHKLGPREELNLCIKTSNEQDIFFKILQHSSVEIPVRERNDGVVAIPFKLKKYIKT